MKGTEPRLSHPVSLRRISPRVPTDDETRERTDMGEHRKRTNLDLKVEKVPTNERWDMNTIPWPAFHLQDSSF